MSESIDVCFSYDTTGSMATAIAQVRKNIKETVKYLFAEIPNLRVAMISHGDYCDGANCIKVQDFTRDEAQIVKAINSFPDTHGGDADECYELALNTAKKLDWQAYNKALVLIGDCNPHERGYTYNGVRNSLDWRTEAKDLTGVGINIYPIQALNRYESTAFYQGLADISKTVKLDLNQFADINQILMSIVMHRASKLDQYEQTLTKSKTKISWGVADTINRLSGKTRIKFVDKKDKDLKSVNPARFQIFNVDNDCSIKDFVIDNGLVFKVGRGFYEFTKPVTIQDYKEVVIEDKNNGDMFNGDDARKKLGIPIGKSAKVAPDKFTKEWRGFIQSTSNNRKLLAGTKFMYEVVD